MAGQHDERPGGALDRGLAMLVDQDDTPFFIGAIHRVLTGTSFEAIREAAAGHAQLRPMSEAEAVAELAPDTLVVTDGRQWAALRLYLATAAALFVLGPNDDRIPVDLG